MRLGLIVSTLAAVACTNAQYLMPMGTPSSLFRSTIMLMTTGVSPASMDCTESLQILACCRFTNTFNFFDCVGYSADNEIW